MNQDSILVTGSTGFVGNVVSRTWPGAIAWPKSGDLSSSSQVRETLAKVMEGHRFGYVLHLAAQSNPAMSRKQALRTWKVNTLGTVALCESLSELSWQGKLLFVSTGALYASSDTDLTEEHPLDLSSPYAASKFAAESAVFEWGRRTGNQVVVARPFNHSGAGQSESYFLPSMAAQLARLPDSGGEIEVGNLKVERDFSHVSDIVAAYKFLLDKGVPGEIYNLASGRSLDLESVLQKLIQLRGCPVKVKTASDRYRKDSSRLRVDISKISQLGWAPRRGLDELLEELMNEWMETTCQKAH